jgi:membrane-bound lytic murein transglycosylase B
VLGAPSGCGLGWTTLAGIGWVESGHGTVGGRTLDASGRPSTPIVGPALDGAGPVAAIRATPASARLHGDPQWDHAVGPLQFLPSTWETWARDGDGDGTADPQDLDDAAAAAAAYLCGTGYDLSTGPGWSAAVYAYNHSASYVSGVYLAATTYASRAAAR